jgi:hypothetical protein
MDFFIAPIYFIVIYFIIARYGNRNYSKNEELLKPYKHAFVFKIIGTTFFSFVYQYYYMGGDTMCFFFWSRAISETLFHYPSVWFNYIFSNDYNSYSIIKGSEWALEKSGGIFQCFWMLKYGGSDPYFIKITSFITLLGSNLYLPTSILFATISFVGTWKLFLVFVDVYPNNVRIFSKIILYIPSIIFWGSGILKDSITFACIGYITHLVYFGLIKKQKTLSRLFQIFLFSSIILSIKGYIILSFIPAAAYWVFSEYKNNIKNSTLRTISTPFFLFLGLAFTLIIINQISSSAGRYSLDKVETTAKDYQRWHTVASEDGSGYSLGDVSEDFSIGSLLVKFPLAVNVTLFRPYPWEAKSVIMLFSAFESAIILYFTLVTILKVGLVKSLNIISSSSFIIFCLFFSLVFAFAVGFTSYNFGALVRYKIPCIPFYLASIVALRIESGKFTK